MPGLELPDVPEDRQRSGNRIKGEEGLERVEVDLATRERPQLGGECELAVCLPVVERLDPVAVAGKHEPSALGVPDRNREHPAQPVCEALAVLFVEMDEHLGVAARREPVPRALEVVAQLAVVVDLAVLDDGDPPSSFAIGWSPVARSMIARRRAASPTGPSTYEPSESGPRWTRVALIAASRPGSPAPRVVAIPQIPHMPD